MTWTDASLLREAEDRLAHALNHLTNSRHVDAYVLLAGLRAEIVAHHDAGDAYNDEQDPGCVACGEPRSEHVGPPAPPLTRGHLGATEDRPGSCLTTTGEHVHTQIFHKAVDAPIAGCRADGYCPTQDMCRNFEKCCWPESV